MNACSVCGTDYYPGALFCEACGAAVHPAAKAHVAALKTKRQAFPAVQTVGPDPNPVPIDRETGGLTVYLPDRHKVLTIRSAIIHVGRFDPDLGFKPELDLTPFDGLDMGVSRRHALIRREAGGYVIIDQQSSNGTWLDGARLSAGRPYPLPPKAAVRFGDLLVQLSTAD